MADSDDQVLETVIDAGEASPEVESRTPAVSSELEARARRASMLKGTSERRQLDIDGLECRTLDDGTIRMGGWGSVTENWYDIGDPDNGGFRERIAKNAFRRTLSNEPDVVLLVNHEGLPLARTKNGSLALSEDAKGLRWQADMDGDDPDSRALARKVDRGLLDQCSFAFRCDSDVWNEDYTERTVKSLTIHGGDVSVVTRGANPATSVTTLRSADGEVELRAGKVLSAANSEQLTKVLNLISQADDAVDEAQPLLAGVLGVANPDADDEASEPAEADEPAEGARAAEPEAPEAKVIVIPDYTSRARERLAQLRRAS